LHFNDPIPNIKLNLKNRNKQLCKPLLRLFQGTKAVDEIKESLWQIISEKKSRKADSIEARIYKIIDGLVRGSQQSSLNEDEVVLTSAEIRDSVIKDLNGKDILGKPQSWATEDYGIVTQHKIASIAEDILLGKNDKKNGAKIFIFSKKKLTKIGENYSNDWIKIIVDTKTKTNLSGASGPSGPFRDSIKDSGAAKVTENVNNPNCGVEDIQDNIKNVERITTQTSEKESEHLHKGQEGPEGPETSQLETSAQRYIESSSKPENNPNHPGGPSQPSQIETGRSDTKQQSTEDYEAYVARQKKVFDTIGQPPHDLTTFGFDDPIRGKDMRTDTNIAVKPTNEDKKEKEAVITQPTTDVFSSEQKSTFWRVFEPDKISDDKLHGALVSSGKFTQSDAAMIIRDMARGGLIVEVSDSGDTETYWRRK